MTEEQNEDNMFVSNRHSSRGSIAQSLRKSIKEIRPDRFSLRVQDNVLSDYVEIDSKLRNSR